MKLQFDRNDSFYKIHKILEKLKTKKSVIIEIHPQNSVFDNIWFGKELIDTLNENNIDYQFICKDNKTRKYYKQLGTEPILDKGNSFFRAYKIFYDFFIKAGNIHKEILRKRDYFSYILIFFEIGILFYVFRFFYQLISPNATITIRWDYTLEEIVYNFRYFPAWQEDKYQESNFLSIPYHTGMLSFEHTISIPVDSIKYLQKPSKWKIRVYNTSMFDYSLVANTKFVTEDGLVFTCNDRISLPPWTKDKPTEAVVDAQAVETDLTGNLIWVKWNIIKGTKLYVKNLKESFYLKELYAVAETDFGWWESITDWTVSQKDMDILSDKLKDYVVKNKKILLQNKLKKDDKILMPYDDFMSLNITWIDFNGKIWDKLSLLDGTVHFEIWYRYIVREDFRATINKYLQERMSENRKLVNMDKNSLVFYNKYRVGENFAVPTKVDLVWGYDFEKDINWIKNEILSKISNKSKAEAEKVILSYPEVWFVDIKISPSWYNILPNLKSNIKLNY